MIPDKNKKSSALMFYAKVQFPIQQNILKFRYVLVYKYTDENKTKERAHQKVC